MSAGTQPDGLETDSLSSAISIDCEFVWARTKPVSKHLAPVVVSIGIVDAEVSEVKAARLRNIDNQAFISLTLLALSLRN